jgi:hypothetical protein
VFGGKQLMANWDIWLTYGVSIELPDGIDPNEDENLKLTIDTLTAKLNTISTSELASESQWETPIKQYIEEN